MTKAQPMKTNPNHLWSFTRRFRRGGFGWKSQPAAAAVKAAVAEIKLVARFDPLLGAEGAVKFLEKVSPALEHVDSSSGAIGKAVNKAIEALVPIIAGAATTDSQREKWLRRLYEAIENDEIPYIELLPEYWGELCVTPQRASAWADEFLPLTRKVLTAPPGEYWSYKGSDACFSALFKAGRYDEIRQLLKLPRSDHWSYQQWGDRVLTVEEKKTIH